MKNTPIIIFAILFIIGSFIFKVGIFFYPLIVISLTLVSVELGMAFILLTCGFNFAEFYDGYIGPLHPNSIQVIGMLLFGIINLFKLKKIKINLVPVYKLCLKFGKNYP